MLKTKILNKEKTIGMYVQLCDISIAKIAGMAGYDFVWVDTEHSFMSLETLMGHIYALRSTGTPVIVRLPQDDLTATKRVLEMGVDGIIFPMVKTAEEVNRLIASTLYPPHGDRGFGPMNAIDFGLKNTAEYIKNSKDKLCRFIQIEHRDAIENLTEIMKNPYIDGYIFGANDLSGSYGMLGEVFSDKITKIISDTIELLHKNGKYVAIASGGYSEEVISHWSALGADMLSAGADFDFIRDSALKNRINLEKLHKNR
ncbi:MAG: aldolase [Ruminococcaceae bacterium]|nr:aldolase [Oscillospiraceae bacterium]